MIRFGRFGPYQIYGRPHSMRWQDVEGTQPITFISNACKEITDPTPTWLCLHQDLVGPPKFPLLFSFKFQANSCVCYIYLPPSNLESERRRKFAKFYKIKVNSRNFDDHDWIRKCRGRRTSTITWCATSTATIWPPRPSSATTVVCGPRAPPSLRFSLILQLSLFPISLHCHFIILSVLCLFPRKMK